MGSDKNWQAECDLRTLKEAESIRVDNKRLAAARRYAAAEQKALNKVVGSGVKSPKSRGKK